MPTPNVEKLLKLADTYANCALRVATGQTNRPEAIAVEARAALTNALQSQAERIATLEGDVEYLQKDINAMCNAIPDYRWSGGAAELIAECFAERDTLRAQLAESADLLQSQTNRIAELEANLRVAQMSTVDKCAEIYTLRAQLAESADLLQSQAERINELEQALQTGPEIIAGLFARAVNMEKERDTLRAELAAIDASEPVAIVADFGIAKYNDFVHRNGAWSGPYKNDDPLFTRPMPAESKDAERYRWLRDYLISPSTHFDDLIVSADKADTLDGVIDAARVKGTK